MENENILEIKNITKAFPGVVALDNVSLTIKKGEVRILVGENGAGKSTLIKILCGMHQPNSGEIVYLGKNYDCFNPHDAMQAGIRCVYQEFNLLSHLSVAENIFFEWLPRKFGLVDYPKLYREAAELLATVGLDISPKTPVEMLGVAQMQLIEIAKALSGESKVLILDEPTATLTHKEIENLFKIIHKLKAQGVTIIYISHRLQEIFEIGDNITVLKNGTKIGTCPTKDVTIPEIVKMMVGRSMDEEYPFKKENEVGSTMFEVVDLQCKTSKHKISFSVKRGELLGISGLVGSGRTEAMRAIFGADPKLSGTLLLNGREIKAKSPRHAVKNGICLLTEDRKEQGLLLDMPCYKNITLTNLPKVSKNGVLKRNEEIRIADNYVNDLVIKTPSSGQWAGNLSGGNQQKVVIAKWLFRDTDVLIFDEPTRGIDVGAKYEIYLLLWKLAAMGKAIIIVSSDLPELMGICHRMLVFSDGKIAGELDREEFDEEKILSLAYTEYIQKNNA